MRRVIETSPARRHVLVVDGDEDVTGFAFIGPERVGNRDAEKVGELYSIYVLPAAWGRGVGQALMAEVLSLLRAEGFEEAILWVLEDNPRTRRFYELTGWQPDGGVKDEEWLGTVVREIRYRIVLAR